MERNGLKDVDGGYLGERTVCVLAWNNHRFVSRLASYTNAKSKYTRDLAIGKEPPYFDFLPSIFKICYALKLFLFFLNYLRSNAVAVD